MRIAIHLIIICILFVLLIRYMEHKTIFAPSRIIEQNPSDIGLEFEDVYFITDDDIKLNGWFVKANNAQMTFLFTHGNGGNICHRLDKLAFFHKMGVNVFLFDYRGYGLSQGRPSEKGIYKDALAAYAYLSSRDDINKDKIIAYGASLGGAVAVDLASKRKLAGLIVDSSFSSAKDMAKVVFPLLPSIFIQTKLDSINKIQNVKIPKLFLHSVNDDIVPYKFGKKLYDAAPLPKKFIALEGDHNSNFFQEQEKFNSSIKEFIEQL